jgi:sugar phosphate isomerase/epimerase
VIAISIPSLSLIDFRIALAQVGKEFSAWEIVAEGKHYLPDIEKEFLDATSSFEIDFSVHAPLSDVNIGSLNPRARELSVLEVCETIRVAGRMNIDLCTIHPGFFGPMGMLDKPAVINKTRESLAVIEEVAQDSGVRVALENMPNMGMIMMGRSPGELLTLLEGLELGICLDIGHAHTAGTIDDFLRLKDRVINVHMHDNLGDRDAHLPIGEGKIDFKKVLLDLSGYDGRYVIEARNLTEGVLSRDRMQTLLASL